MIRAAAFDLDGVVYEGDTVIKGAVETINALKTRGIDVYFVTNNSGKKRASIATKLKKMGIESAVDSIITSGYAAAFLVNSICNTHEDRILVLGSEDLEEEFASFGRKVVRKLPADVLVVGFDKSFNYERLSLGLSALNQGAIFAACNRDRVFPVEGNQVLPGCGAIVAALEWASGREADYVAGKPNTIMLELISRERGFKPHEILVVGDMLESDIAMANQFGCPSVLVMRNDLQDSARAEIFPKYHINSVEMLLHIINWDS